MMVKRCAPLFASLFAAMSALGCSSDSSPGNAPASDAGADTQTTTDAASDAPSDAAVGPDDVSSLLEPIRASHALPGLTGGVVSGNDLLALGTTGVRKLGDPTLATQDDRWHLGSETKAMTATLMAVLVEDKTISWTQTLPDAFPSLASKFDPAYASVTLEQLLQHRGGLPNVVPPAIWGPLWTDKRPLPEQRTWFVEQILAPPPAGSIGSFDYSNAGYMVVGAALEAATGQSWEQLMQTRLFQPLSMNDCGFGPPASAGKTDQPWGHKDQSGTLTPVAPDSQGADNPAAVGPAGTVHCSMQSWARFLAEHAKGPQGKSTLLPAAAFTKMHAPPPGGDYAMGWGVADRSWAGGTVLTHDGSNTLFYATTWVAPKIDRAFFAATNQAGSAGPAAVDNAVSALIPKYAP